MFTLVLFDKVISDVIAVFSMHTFIEFFSDHIRIVFSQLTYPFGVWSIKFCARDFSVQPMCMCVTCM